MTTQCVTLSRAHIIAERLTKEITRASATAQTSRSGSFRARPTQDQIASLQAKAQEAQNALRKHALLVRTLVGVRSVIGQANAETGVSALLAAIDGNKKELSLLNQLQDAVEADQGSSHIDSLEEVTWPDASSPYSPAVTLVAGDPALRAEVIARIKGLERENFRLSDRIAALNGNTVVLSLPDDLVEDLSL